MSDNENPNPREGRIGYWTVMTVVAMACVYFVYKVGKELWYVATHLTGGQ